MENVNDDSLEEKDFEEFDLSYSHFMEIYTSDLKSQTFDTMEFKKSSFRNVRIYENKGSEVKEIKLEYEQVKLESLSCDGLKSNYDITNCQRPTDDVGNDMAVNKNGKNNKTFSDSGEREHEIVKDSNCVLKYNENVLQTIKCEVEDDNNTHFDMILVKTEKQNSIKSKNRLDDIVKSEKQTITENLNRLDNTVEPEEKISTENKNRLDDTVVYEEQTYVESKNRLNYTVVPGEKTSTNSKNRLNDTLESKEQTRTESKNRLNDTIDLEMENNFVEENANDSLKSKIVNLTKKIKEKNMNKPIYHCKLGDQNNNDYITVDSEIICLDDNHKNNDIVESLDVKVEIFAESNPELKIKKQTEMKKEIYVKKHDKKANKETVHEEVRLKVHSRLEKGDGSLKSEDGGENSLCSQNQMGSSKNRNDQILGKKSIENEDEDIMIIEYHSRCIELIDITTEEQKRPLAKHTNEIETLEVEFCKENSEKIQKSYPKLEDMERIRLSGEHMEKYLKLPMFSKVVIGCFVKLKVYEPSGVSFLKLSKTMPDQSQPKKKYYRGSRVSKGVEMDKIRSKVYNQVFPLNNIIDYMFLNHEYEEWIEECCQNNYERSTIEYVLNKEKEITNIDKCHQVMDNDPFCLGNQNYLAENNPYWLQSEKETEFYCSLCKKFLPKAKQVLLHIVNRRHSLKAATSLECDNILRDGYMIKALIFHEAYKTTEQETTLRTRIFFKCPSCEINLTTVRKLLDHLKEDYHVKDKDDETIEKSLKNLLETILKMIKRKVKNDRELNHVKNTLGNNTEGEGFKTVSKKLKTLNHINIENVQKSNQSQNCNVANIDNVSISILSLFLVILPNNNTF
ncbi:unnamed protein product, partial [Meganyctiphanes norvegica]